MEIEKVKFIEMFVSFIDEVNKKNNEDISSLESITIIGGKNKDNEIEDCKLTIVI